MRSRVSIVIPVYNEEDSLRACLESIAAQFRKPLEVIVVDNNSRDATVKVARSFPFVKVLREPQQGVVYARNRGFNAARGDIIGRIDADTILAADWVASVEKLFDSTDIACASGLMRYHDLSFGPLANRIDLAIRRYLARQLGDDVAMQGANMAMRRSWWQTVRHEVCEQSGLHEDFDLGIHIRHAGGRLCFSETMKADIGFRQAGSSWAGFSEYVLLSPRTYRLHGLESRRHMYPVVYLAISCFFIIKFAHRSYDADVQGFSWKKLMAGSEDKTRVNPATFVD